MHVSKPIVLVMSEPIATAMADDGEDTEQDENEEGRLGTRCLGLGWFYSSSTKKNLAMSSVSLKGTMQGERSNRTKWDEEDN